MTKTVRLKIRMSGMMTNQKQIYALKSKWSLSSYLLKDELINGVSVHLILVFHGVKIKDKFLSLALLLPRNLFFIKENLAV